MDKEIIIPEGKDLLDYLNKGYEICNKCGAVMYHRKDPKGGCDILVCPNCGEEVDEFDYVYEDDPGEFSDDANSPPPGCIECDGPWPDCADSCKMFDD